MGVSASAKGAVTSLSDTAASDDANFGNWVRPHLPMLSALAATQVGTADADDVVQEALVRAWRRRSTYDPARGSARSWLAAIVLDRACRHRSRRRRAPESAPEAGYADPELDHVDVAVAALPQRQREVVTLHYLVDLSVRDVAAALGISEGSVKSHLHDARAKLRASLENR